jgi:hypothetical protein
MEVKPSMEGKSRMWQLAEWREEDKIIKVFTN